MDLSYVSKFFTDFIRRTKVIIKDTADEFKYIYTILKHNPHNLFEYSWELSIYKSFCLIGFCEIIVIIFSFLKHLLGLSLSPFWSIFFFPISVCISILIMKISLRKVDLTLLDYLTLLTLPFLLRTICRMLGVIFFIVPLLPKLLTLFSFILIGFYLYKLNEKYKLGDTLGVFLCIIFILFIS